MADIVLDETIGEVGLKAIGEVLERAEDADQVAIDALDKIREALDDWRVEDHGVFGYNNTPDSDDFEALDALCSVWVPRVHVDDYRPAELAKNAGQESAEATGK
ncbi:MAG: hypothetical protein HZA95_02145 [Candidatus Vogelbacteria bacterium]|nr:hypothetical protein [Candidatus Vogelbacteria bacterium]